MYFDLNDQARMELQLTKINNYHQQVEKIYLIGHRGMGVSNVLQQPEHSSLVFLENTVASFKEAIILGADGIELDVFSSKDRHVMVIHSDELRMHVCNNCGDEELLIQESSKTFIVGNKTYNQLRKLVVGPQGELIPTLSEILELVT
ncbi:MAG: glycerophosphodiester phosphodiesterase, partial [Gammaproteobacteria bacterium]